MRLPSRLLPHTALLLLPLLVACAQQQYATFVTKTAIAVADVDPGTGGASIGYQRFEGYVGPKLADGQVMPVVGYVATPNNNALFREVRQVYATGCAAELVAPAASGAASFAHASVCAQSGSASASASAPEPAVSAPLLFFTTGTTIGLHFSIGPDSLPNMNFGYRRKEASAIPVERGQFPSVLATHDNSATAPASAPASGTRARPGLGVNQYFATGRAAEQLATDPDIRKLFKDGARNALDTLREEDREQLRHANLALVCATRVEDAALDKVWANAEALGLVDEAEAAALRKHMADKEVRKARSLHADLISERQNDQPKITRLLELHRQRVCGLAGR